MQLFRHQHHDGDREIRRRRRAHGTGGFTGTNVIAMTGPTNAQTVSAWEQGARCDLFDSPGAPECTPEIGGGVTNSQVGLLQTPAVPGFIPDWVVPPVAPAPGESLYWWPLTSNSALTQGSLPYNTIVGTAANIMMEEYWTAAWIADPVADWGAVGPPPLTLTSVTKVYGAVRGSWNALLGIPGVWSPFSGQAWTHLTGPWLLSNPQYFLISPSTLIQDPTLFPWTSYTVELSAPSSVYDSVPYPGGTPGTTQLTDVGFLIYVTSWPYRVEPIDTESQFAITYPSGCKTQGQAGWERNVTNQVQRQDGSPYAVSGLTVADTISIGNVDYLGLRKGFPKTGHTTTTGDGSFPDTYSDCSTACPGSTGYSNAFQLWTVNGVPLFHPNAVIYKCQSITIDRY